MLLSSKTSLTSVTSVKPRNVFYVWYVELCRRSNMSPLSLVKPVKLKNDRILNFVADCIKPEEWTPIVKALGFDTSLHVITIRCRINSCKFLYEVNTEDKARRMKRRCGSIWTDYFLRLLLNSISTCLKITEVLSSLELNGLPIYADYLKLLLPNLRYNKTLKMLSFQHCPIGDDGCRLLCFEMRCISNVEVLNLSSCDLSSISGQYIAEVIKCQQLSRCCASWHNSLRYKEPELKTMLGLKRVILNNNPNIGDEGLHYILDELADDLWIKAIDMRRCNITENMSKEIIDVVKNSTSLEIVDFRNNEKLSFASVEKILEILKTKQHSGNDLQYQWCATSSSLCDFGNASTTRSNVSCLNATIQQSKSKPLKQTHGFVQSTTTLRKTKTLTTLDSKKPKCFSYFNKSSNQSIVKHNQMPKLNTKFQEEAPKRKENSERISELENRVQDIKFLVNLYSEIAESKTLTFQLINGIQEVLQDNQRTNMTSKKTINKIEPKKTLNKQILTNKRLNYNKVKHIRPAIKQISPIAQSDTESLNSPFTENLLLITQTLFKKMLTNNDDSECPEIMQEDETENDMLRYYSNDESQEEHPIVPKIHTLNTESSYCPQSESNIALEKFLLELEDGEDE